MLLNGESPYANSELVSLLTGLILLLSVLRIGSPRRALNAFLKGWLLAYFATSIVAVREMFFGIRFENYFQQGPAELLDGFGIASVLNNPNNYAFF